MIATFTGERAELLGTLARHRLLLRRTVAGLTDAQAALRPTASALCLGGLVKHVTYAERSWIDFVVEGASAKQGATAESMAEHAASFVVLPDETLDELLERYDAAAGRTDDVIAALPHLDIAHPLPEAPWYPPGACWSARQVLLHLIGETAQHAGHADIIRETIDGQQSMG